MYLLNLETMQDRDNYVVSIEYQVSVLHARVNRTAIQDRQDTVDFISKQQNFNIFQFELY